MRPIIQGNIEKYRLEIYNRWGQLVFQSDNPSTGWDGNIKTASQSTDSFVWFCQYQFAGEKEMQKKRNIYIDSIEMPDFSTLLFGSLTQFLQTQVQLFLFFEKIPGSSPNPVSQEILSNRWLLFSLNLVSRKFSARITDRIKKFFLCNPLCVPSFYNR